MNVTVPRVIKINPHHAVFYFAVALEGKSSRNVLKTYESDKVSSENNEMLLNSVRDCSSQKVKLVNGYDSICLFCPMYPEGYNFNINCKEPCTFYFERTRLGDLDFRVAQELDLLGIMGKTITARRLLETMHKAREARR
ncbi:MAG: hypothetical protein AABX66_03130 [Nanoarchaeota archaeon]